MKIIYNGEDKVLKYTFHSFKFMEDLNLGEMDTLDQTPFRLIGIVQTLLLGALNHNPKEIYNEIQVDEILEDIVENGSIVETLEGLIALLQESSFFKSLQEKPKTVKKTTPKK